MSELQLGLLGIGVLVLVSVFAYNKWQEARLRKKTEAAFGVMSEDPLLATPMPATEGAAAVGGGSSVSDDRVEHTLGDVDAEAPVHSLAYSPLNDVLDYIATLTVAEPLSGSQWSEALEAGLKAKLAAYVHWEAFDEASQSWRALRREFTYTQVRAGFQLADESGLRTHDEVERFNEMMPQLAERLGARLDIAPWHTTMTQQQTLERLREEYDVQVGLSVVAGERFTISGTKIRGIAESAGFTLGKDGRYHKYDEEGVELYVLANLEPMPFHAETMKTLSTRGVTLLLNVPRAPGLPTTFRNYIKFARQLAEGLDGTLVDDNEQPIGPRAIEQVGTQLSALHEEMAQLGVPAGSAAARRLFA